MSDKYKNIKLDKCDKQELIEIIKHHEGRIKELEKIISQLRSNSYGIR